MDIYRDRWIPEPTPETQHFWDGTKAGELRLQHCTACHAPYFPPRSFCPRCTSREVDIKVSSGRAKLLSYVISHRPAPGYEPPYSVAIVELDEGPHMLTNIVGCEQTPESLVLDMPLVVVFTPISDDIYLAQFRPLQSNP